jgi:hypothetical protein
MSVDSCEGAAKTAEFADVLPVADFWKEIGEMSKADALAQLEKHWFLNQH